MKIDEANFYLHYTFLIKLIKVWIYIDILSLVNIFAEDTSNDSVFQPVDILSLIAMISSIL